MSFPARVAIDDKCDGCGIASGPGVAFGQGRPVLCNACIERAYKLACVCHYLRGGRAVCGLAPGKMPIDWPAGHVWSGDWKDVTCVDCHRTRWLDEGTLEQ